MKQFITFINLLFLIISISTAQSKDTITTKSGLKYFLIKEGNGKAVDSGSVVTQHFTMWLSNGKKYDSTRDSDKSYTSKITYLIRGMQEALLLMKVGDRGKFIIPYQLAYGEKGVDDIPPKETLIFDIEVLDVKSNFLRAELLKVVFDESFKTDSIPKVKEAILSYKKLKEMGFPNLHISQYELNAIGYKLIKKYPEHSLEFFKLNVEEYPNEANPYDSLGECYMKLGKNKLAIINFKKALKLDPKKKNSLKLLKELTGQ